MLRLSEDAPLVAAGLLLVVGSTLDRWNVTAGEVNIYPAHLVAITLIPLGLARRPELMSVRNAALVLLGATIVAFLPAVLLLPESEARLRIMLQTVANLISFVVAFSVFDALSSRGLVRLLRYIVLVAVTGVAGQLALAMPEDSRFLGLPRPFLLFSEPTWFAMAAAMVLSASLALRLKHISMVLGAIVLVVFTRAALVMAGLSLLMCFGPPRRLAFVRWVLILGVSVGSLAIVWGALSAPEPVPARDSLDSRALDVWVIRVANNDSFLPWGGEVLTARVEGFWQEVEGSNVAFVEYLWKFGLGGVFFFAAWSLTVAVVLPRRLFRSGHPEQSERVWIVWIVLATLPAVVQINNALGRPWLWILVALLLSTGTRLAAPSVDAFASPVAKRVGAHRSSGGDEAGGLLADVGVVAGR